MPMALERSQQRARGHFEKGVGGRPTVPLETVLRADSVALFLLATLPNCAPGVSADDIAMEMPTPGDFRVRAIAVREALMRLKQRISTGQLDIHHDRIINSRAHEYYWTPTPQQRVLVDRLYVEIFDH